MPTLPAEFVVIVVPPVPTRKLSVKVVPVTVNPMPVNLANSEEAFPFVILTVPAPNTRGATPPGVLI